MDKLNIKTNMRIAILFGILALCSSQMKCGAQAGGITMATGLSIAMSKAQDLIRDAKSAGNDLELQAGLNLQNAVSAAQAAYAKSLQSTFDTFNDSERKTYTDIDNLVKKVSIDWKTSSAKITDDAQLIVGTFPFARKFPQVSSFDPSYANPDNSIYKMSVSGYFPFSHNGKHRPEIEISGERIKAATATDLLLTFDIPSAEFGASAMNALALKEATLHIPWDSSGALNPFTTVRDGIFTLQLAKLPTSPGTLTLYHEVQTNRTEISTIRSGSYNFDSHADDIEENRSLDLSDADWDAGWRIVQSSGYFILDKHNEGDEGHDWYNKGLQGQNDRSVIWRVRTEHKGMGSSGKIIWGIGAQVSRVVTETVQIPETVPLTWGMQKILNYPPGKWKAVWKRFDGRELEYNKTDLSNSFLQFSADDNSVTLITFGL